MSLCTYIDCPTDWLTDYQTVRRCSPSGDSVCTVYYSSGRNRIIIIGIPRYLTMVLILGKGKPL